MAETATNVEGGVSLTASYSRLVALSVALVAWAVVAAAGLTLQGEIAGVSISRGLLLSLGFIAGGKLALLVNRFLQRNDRYLVSLAERQASFVDRLPSSLVPAAILFYAGLSLFLELAVIRWQASVVPILAFYKNFSLIAAFAGLGLGYALFRRRHIPLFSVIPILGYQLVTFWLLRIPTFSSAHVGRINPFVEQSAMGINQATTAFELAGVYLMLASVFLSTALAFVPIGQVVGRLMERRGNITSYGLNLARSVLGVVAMYAVSAMWAPPVVWFGVAFAALIPLFGFDTKIALTLSVVGLFSVIVVAIPPRPGTGEIYSPYQLLEKEATEAGDLVIRAAGHFLLVGADLRSKPALSKSRAELAAFYELPFQVANRLDSVLVVGAGAGNDVAAGLRVGAERIDAVEIDPAIVSLGREGHPEMPFQDQRVNVIVDDARSFFVSTSNRYELIIYGLLDSHSVVSHGSSVRMDSFVYTVEGLREARSRLSEDGVLSLSFFAFNDELAEKLYLMLTEAFDGVSPRVISAGGRGLVYLHGSKGPPQVSPGLFSTPGFVDVTDQIASMSLGTDLATDDWPFLYMPKRVFPVSYLGMIVLVLALSGLLIRSLLRDGFEIGNVGYFFLGAGFLLVETKGITELGLAFGNTWQVVGVVITAVLIMAYLANLVVARFERLRLRFVIVLLLASVALGYVLSVTGATTDPGNRRWLVLAALTLPVFFSGLAFSLGLRVAASISGVMAANIAGAIFGGLVEYNSMMFGFRSLYLIAGVMYGAGGVLLLRMFDSKGDSDASVTEAPSGLIET